MSADAITHQLEGIVAPQNLLSWKNIDSSVRERLISGLASPVEWVVTPATVEELSEVVAYAHREEMGITPFGRGSKFGWGRKTQAQIAISTAKLNRLVEVADKDLTLTAEAGMPYSLAKALLRPFNQQLGLDPSYASEATLGGIVATANTGSLRQRYGGLRDMVLGISFVRSDGKLVKAGGRVVKNVAGYDLMKLLAGSYGTLGIITQLTIRAYPKPEQSKSLGLYGPLKDVAAIAHRLRSSGLTPTAFDWVSASIFARASAAADVEVDLSSGSIGLLIRFQSIPSSIEAQQKTILEWAKDYSALEVVQYGEEMDSKLWNQVQGDRHGFPDSQPGTDTDYDSVCCKVGIEPAKADQLIEIIQSQSPAPEFIIHASSGIGWMNGSTATLKPKYLNQLRQICQPYNGHLTVLSLPSSFPDSFDLWGYPNDSLVLMKALARQFDPHTSLNPYRLWPPS